MYIFIYFKTFLYLSSLSRAKKQPQVSPQLYDVPVLFQYLSMIKRRLNTVIPRDTIRLQIQPFLQRNGVGSGSFSVPAVYLLMPAKYFVAPALPPFHHMPIGARHIGSSGFSCLKVDISADILCPWSVFPIFHKSVSMGIKETVKVGRRLEIQHIDIDLLSPVRFYHIIGKLRIKPVQICVTSDARYFCSGSILPDIDVILSVPQIRYVSGIPDIYPAYFRRNSVQIEIVLQVVPVGIQHRDISGFLHPPSETRWPCLWPVSL